MSALAMILTAAMAVPGDGSGQGFDLALVDS
jgi:hypothetical protein